MTQQHQIPTFDPTKQRQVVPPHMELVVNAVDVPIRFEIASYPGSPPTEFYLRPGDRAQLPKSYCDGIYGANAAVPRASVLAMLTSVHAYPGGPQIQGVVPVRDAERIGREWAEAKRNRPKVATVMLTDNQGQQVPLSVPRLDARAELQDDDQDEIEEPPPDAPDIRPGASQEALKSWAAEGTAPVAEQPAAPTAPAAVKTVGGAKPGKAKD